MGLAYLAVTACYLLSGAILLGFRLAPRAEPGRSRGAGRAGGALTDLRSGVAYMRLSPTIVAIMFLAFLVNLTVFPLTNGSMPVVARDVFGGGPEVLALLLSAASVGALAGSLGLVAAPRVRRPERIMLLSIVSWHLLLLAFAGAAAVAGARLAAGVGGGAALGLVLVVLLAYGASTSGSMVTMSAVLLGTAGAAFRGRVMGVRMMAVYGLPLGLLLGGWLSERVGVLGALGALGVSGLLLSAGAALRWPALHRRAALHPAPAKA
jgi:hypothetical protein